MNVVAKIIIGVSLFAASCSEQEDLGYRIDCRIDSGRQGGGAGSGN